MLRAPQLSNRQFHAVVERLHHDPALSVDDAMDGRRAAERPDPLSFVHLIRLCDLCRQHTRLLSHLLAQAGARRCQGVGLRHGTLARLGRPHLLCLTGPVPQVLDGSAGKDDLCFPGQERDSKPDFVP